MRKIEQDKVGGVKDILMVDADSITKIGRPTIKTEEVINELLDRIMQGESVRKICEDDDMPDQVTIYRWLRDDEDFCQKYARAKEISSHSWVEESFEIADAAMTRTDAEVAKVRIQARQWAASKLNPKKYGDKLQATIDHRILPPPKWIDKEELNESN
jgi:hypothetical protein